MSGLEALPLVLEEVGEGLLAALELVEYRGELLLELRHLVRVRVMVRLRLRLRVRAMARARVRVRVRVRHRVRVRVRVSALASEKTRGSSPMPSMIARKSSSTRRKRA